MTRDVSIIQDIIRCITDIPSNRNSIKALVQFVYLLATFLNKNTILPQYYLKDSQVCLIYIVIG